jgi:hypothetical protein
VGVGDSVGVGVQVLGMLAVAANGTQGVAVTVGV